MLRHRPHWPSVTPAPLKPSAAAPTPSPSGVQPHGPSGLCPLGEGEGISSRQTGRWVQPLSCSPPLPDAGQPGRRPCSLGHQPPPRTESLQAGEGPGRGNAGFPVCPPRGREGQQAACGRQGRSVPAPCTGCPHGRGGHSSTRPTQDVAATCLEPRSEGEVGQETPLGLPAAWRPCLTLPVPERQHWDLRRRTAKAREAMARPVRAPVTRGRAQARGAEWTDEAACLPVSWARKAGTRRPHRRMYDRNCSGTVRKRGAPR